MLTLIVKLCQAIKHINISMKIFIIHAVAFYMFIEYFFLIGIALS